MTGIKKCSNTSFVCMHAQYLTPNMYENVQVYLVLMVKVSHDMELSNRSVSCKSAFYVELSEGLSMILTELRWETEPMISSLTAMR